METVEAQVVDATHLELAHPIQAPPGARLVISIAPAMDDERAAWAYLARGGLESAYGPDEPEYPTALVKVPNPTFAP